MPTLSEIKAGTAKGKSSVPKTVAELVGEVVGPDSPVLWYALSTAGNTSSPTSWNVVVLSGDTKLRASGEVDSSGWRLKGVELYEGE